NESLAACAERGANKELAPPNQRAREQKVREIRASDEQNASCSAAQREKKQPRLPGEFVAQAIDGKSCVFQLRRMLLAKSHSDSMHFCICLLTRHPRAQS